MGPALRWVRAREKRESERGRDQGDREASSEPADLRRPRLGSGCDAAAAAPVLRGRNRHGAEEVKGEDNIFNVSGSPAKQKSVRPDPANPVYGQSRGSWPGRRDGGGGIPAAAKCAYMLAVCSSLIILALVQPARTSKYRCTHSAPTS